MPLFRFNSRTGDTILEDAEGEELPDLAAARVVDVSSAREALLEALKVNDTPPDCIQITDSQGNEVEVVELADILQAD